MKISIMIRISSKIIAIFNNGIRDISKITNF